MEKDQKIFNHKDYYRQLYVDIKIKNHKIKTGINFIIFILIFVEICL